MRKIKKEKVHQVWKFSNSSGASHEAWLGREPFRP